MRIAVFGLAVCVVCSVGCRKRNSEVEAERAKAAAAKQAGATKVDTGFGPAAWLVDATRVVAVKDHAGAPLIIAGGKGWLKTFRKDGTVVSSVKGVGLPQEMELIDVRGDAAPELVVGWGRGRGAMAAPSKLLIHDLSDLNANVERVPMPRTKRADMRGIARAGAKGSLFVAVFDSKYMVSVLEATRGADGTWTTKKHTRARVVLGLSAADVNKDGVVDVLLARPYGDKQDEPGMVVRMQNGKTENLPSERGARAVLALPGAVVMADGWHRNYGRHAKALISRVEWTGSAWKRTVLADVAKRHGYARLRAGDVNGDGALDIVAVGDGPVVSVPLAGGAVSRLTDGKARVIDAFPVDLDGDGKDEVVIVGESPRIWGLSNR